MSSDVSITRESLYIGFIVDSSLELFLHHFWVHIPPRRLPIGAVPHDSFCERHAHYGSLSFSLSFLEMSCQMIKFGQVTQSSCSVSSFRSLFHWARICHHWFLCCCRWAVVGGRHLQRDCRWAVGCSRRRCVGHCIWLAWYLRKRKFRTLSWGRLMA